MLKWLRIVNNGGFWVGCNMIEEDRRDTFESKEDIIEGKEDFEVMWL